MRKSSSGLGTVTTVVMALQKTTKKPCSGTDPEVARVGLNEQDAKRQGVAVEVTRFDLDDLDRALADEEGRGFVKMLTPPARTRSSAPPSLRVLQLAVDFASLHKGAPVPHCHKRIVEFQSDRF